MLPGALRYAGVFMSEQQLYPKHTQTHPHTPPTHTHTPPYNYWLRGYSNISPDLQKDFLA